MAVSMADYICNKMQFLEVVRHTGCRKIKRGDLRAAAEKQIPVFYIHTVRAGLTTKLALKHAI